MSVVSIHQKTYVASWVALKIWPFILNFHCFLKRKLNRGQFFIDSEIYTKQWINTFIKKRKLNRGELFIDSEIYTKPWINTFIKIYLNKVLPVLFMLKSVKSTVKGESTFLESICVCHKLHVEETGRHLKWNKSLLFYLVWIL
jgi:hypothetical protein